MLEQGLVMFIQSNLGSPPMAIGGFLNELPKDYIAATMGPAYTYRIISDIAELTLNSCTGRSRARYEFKCYAFDAAGALALAKAINSALHGKRGITLADIDSTWIDTCFRVDQMDMPYDAYARNYCRQLEYEIQYANTN